MPSMVVVGAQWGDEGKGKIVDMLDADYVARFQGGNNAGHTLVVDGEVFKLHLIPSGILHPQTICAIGAGVVLNPLVFLDELRNLEGAGIRVDPKRLIVDRETNLLLPYHVERDVASEEMRARRREGKIGTTGRGIGPCYEDRAARCGITFADLESPEELREKLAAAVDRSNRMLRAVFESTRQVEVQPMYDSLLSAREQLLQHMGNVGRTLTAAHARGEKILFEGAQGPLLDNIFGTAPFVTSSQTIAAAAATGTGVGPRLLDRVLMVAKAYSTRVGSGSFPTELDGQAGEDIRAKGREFGTTTGRPRRCGWFDAFAVQRAIRLHGAEVVALTKLDVLSGLMNLKVCVGYTLDGQPLQDLPTRASELDRVQPIYKEVAGWEDNIDAVRRWDDLPRAAQSYVEFLEREMGIPVSFVSVGPDRQATIVRSPDEITAHFLRKER